MERILVRLTVLLLSLCACAHALAQAEKDAIERERMAPGGAFVRQVKKNEIISQKLPALRIKFDGAYTYAGSQQFVLYGVAYAEQHFFVDADKDGRIRRLYWLQFEHYLPTNTHSYDYSFMNDSVNLSGLPFFTDARPISITAMRSRARPESDTAKAQTFLQSKGYNFSGDDFFNRRFVHLADEAKRYELLIVYMEDMAGTGFKAADFSKEGKAADRWPEVSKEMLGRALKGFKVSKL